MAKSAFLFEWQNEDEEKEAFFMAERERMRLVYRIPVRSFDEGALRFAEIFLDSEGQLVCDYQDRPWNFFDEDMAENSFRSVLAEDVDSIEFAYVLKEVDLDEVNLEWVDSFSELEIIDRLPAGVRLRVTWNNGDSENFFWRVAGESQFEHSQEMRKLLPQ